MTWLIPNFLQERQDTKNRSNYTPRTSAIRRPSKEPHHSERSPKSPQIVICSANLLIPQINSKTCSDDPPHNSGSRHHRITVNGQRPRDRLGRAYYVYVVCLNVQNPRNAPLMVMMLLMLWRWCSIPFSQFNGESLYQQQHLAFMVHVLNIPLVGMEKWKKGSKKSIRWWIGLV